MNQYIEIGLWALLFFYFVYRLFPKKQQVPVIDEIQEVINNPEYKAKSRYE